MERAKVEIFTAGAVLQVTPHTFNLTLADFVGQRLAGPDDVPIDFVNSLALAEPDVVEEELDRLLARPAQVMDAGVDDKSTASPRLIAEHAEARPRIGIEAQLVGESLGIQRPAFDEGVAQPPSAVAPKRGDILRFLGERDLQVVARDALVKGQCRQRVAWARAGFERVDVERARARAVGRRLKVIRGGCVALAEVL